MKKKRKAPARRANTQTRKRPRITKREAANVLLSLNDTSDMKSQAPIQDPMPDDTEIKLPIQDPMPDDTEIKMQSPFFANKRCCYPNMHSNRTFILL